MTHPGTDLTSLPLPPEARDALKKPREERIHAHAIRVPAAWWNAALTERTLPGGPIGGETKGDGYTTITRSRLFSLASEAESDEEILGLLWHVLAWGSGSKLRHNHRRLVAISRQRQDATNALRTAAHLARNDPEAAYARLTSAGGTRPLLKYLGPSFFTKYLYFAGAGASDHPCAILDSRVAITLRKRCGWASLYGTGHWPAKTYERYCGLLSRWAKTESDHVQREVCPDEIERWLFDTRP
ncbi:hypothetical protein HUT19_18665 [Streptomyces sp. NA02950]|uniref:8-oxoguanine DNA glycosylase OGG fold protein n=1 Tax=Streptomyces sp. NA02950 TaxID=2742137 RepID=UPI0015913080|nr:hypothetical protein [Streptomyces sp. NA02950]QKV93536.1 hypothetical protein HUT19_18665 [Streptomyces sp. NA02950]